MRGRAAEHSTRRPCSGPSTPRPISTTARCRRWPLWWTGSTTTRSLGLTEPERADLTAYLETVGAADEPYEVFDAENTPFRLAFAELTTFASTLDALLPRRDAEHILLLTDTVAADLSADAGTMANLAARPEIYSLAERLAAVGAAVRADDWAAAEVSWAAFQSEAQAIEERAF